MTTLLYSHPACADHDTGPRHPESSQRLAAISRALDGDEFAVLGREQPPRAEAAQIRRMHRSAYVDRVMESAPTQGRRALDSDTVMSPGSLEAALRAAGAVCAAVDAVVTDRAMNAFCAVRPPGHHAEPGHAMGFCIFNNVAIGAAHARAEHQLRRVAVIDFDVHHGNGTQTMFADVAELFYGSTHQWPLYPGTGAEEERGAHGNIVNCPLAPGAGGSDFRRVMTDRLLPALDGFAPELVLISAGFDAHMADPLAQLNLDETDFAWATKEILDIAQRHCGGRVVSTLEGGYDLAALATSTTAHVRALISG